MTVHMFRVCVSLEGYTQEDLQTAVDSWIAEHDKWDGQNTEFAMKAAEGIPGDTSTEYYRGSFRFHQTDTKSNILQKLTDKFTNKVAWYRIGYHACTHDESDPSPCSWDTTTEWTAKDVTVPSFVPQMR